MGKIIKNEKQLERLFEENKIEIFRIEDEVEIDIRLENENELLRLLKNKNEKRVYFYQKKFLKGNTTIKRVEKYALSNKKISGYFKELKEREKNSDKIKHTLIFTIDNGRYVGIKVDNPNFDYELEEEIDRFYYATSELTAKRKNSTKGLQKALPHLIGDRLY